MSERAIVGSDQFEAMIAHWRRRELAWLPWLAANSVGGVGASLLLDRWASFLWEPLGPLLMAAIGLVFGLAQLVALRLFRSNVGRWPLASALGWMFGGATGTFTAIGVWFFTGGGISWMTEYLPIPFILLCTGYGIGIAQWKVLMGYIPVRMHWVWAQAAALLIGGLAFTTTGSLPIVVRGAIGGAIYGVLSGLILERLLDGKSSLTRLRERFAGRAESA